MIINVKIIKRIIIVLLLCLAVIFIALGFLIYDIYCTHGVYRIKLESHCITNHSVGNDWEISYSIDGESAKSGKEYTVPLDKITEKKLKVTIIERDKWSDVSQKYITFCLRDGEKVTTQLTVTEDNGRYTGNYAIWETKVSVKLIKRTMGK